VAAGAVVASLAAAMPSAARGAVQVVAELSTTNATLEEQVTLVVRVSGAREVEAPRIARAATMEIRQVAGPSRSESVMIVNGRATQWLEFRWEYRLTPMRTGRLRLPTIRVRADGEDYQAQALELVVGRSETGPYLIVESEAGDAEVFVEQPLRATLRIWIRAYRQRDGLALNAESLWSLVDREETDFGPFDKPRYVGTRARDDGRGGSASYHLFETDGILWPEQPGPLQLGSVRVTMNYPKWIARDFFGSLRLQDSRRITARPEPLAVTVLPIPTQDRPPGFNGAVGEYRLTASARPTEVSVGEPITLTLTITGTGRLERVAAPPLAQVPELAADFRVPDEPLAGTVDGRSKSFVQTLRAKHADVRRIPPIPLVYFNPLSRRFETAAADPISIRVKAANRLSLSEVVEADTGRPRLAAPLIERTEGLLANFADPEALLEDQEWSVSRGWTVLLVGCPLLYVGTFFVHRRSRRYRDDRAWRRRAHAAATARRLLRMARGGGTTNAELVGDALLGYVADRLDAPAGALTRTEAAHRLTERGVEKSLRGELDDLLAEVEAARYGGLRPGSPDSRLIERAEHCLHELERVRF